MAHFDCFDIQDMNNLCVCGAAHTCVDWESVEGMCNVAQTSRVDGGTRLSPGTQIYQQAATRRGGRICESAGVRVQ